MTKVSIILSCFNGSRFLEEAINSIICQTFTDWELIFVNDGSTDESLKIAESFSEKDSRIKVVSKKMGV